ncbi:hypothetical protein KIW84_020816 [Lathyrus oleraceus]|uniref:Uncharacterized protein n=1 Tax=Pisum sativum TaxID=3888 RepID=A0A9D5B345_PEA|nr:hypothetical protein KIW84_020816 [Pisum sativum]
MHIPNIVERISFQGIDLFLNCITEYNEDLVKLFYTGVAKKFEGFRFTCNIGNNVVEVNDDVWKSLFEISLLSSPNDLKITDSAYASEYDFRTALNQMLRKLFSPEVVQSTLFHTNVTTARLYKTRQPVPDTNARPMEECDDDDDGDDDDDDDEDAYDVLEITLSTQSKKLEVLYELLVVFDNVKDNGNDLLPVVKFQGWESFFNRLQGPFFFNLVRELQLHFKSSLFQVTSFVFGKKIVIFKKLISKLVGHYWSGIRHE